MSIIGLLIQPYFFKINIMKQQEIMDLLHSEIDYNSKLATKYLNEKDTTNANMRIYANGRLIKLAKELNKLVWQQ